jgi:hypothetical protein
VQLPGGRWISEKDPGYPYLAVAFQALGLIRLGADVAAIIPVSPCPHHAPGEPR